MMSNIVKTLAGQYERTIDTFVSSIAASYPQFTFTFYTLGAVKVTSGREHIGELKVVTDYTRAGASLPKIELRNRRITAVRYRGDAYKTGDMKKATKLFATFFISRSAEERMKEAADVLKSHGQRFARQLRETTIHKIASVLDTKAAELSAALKGLVDIEEYAPTVGTVDKALRSGVYVVHHDGGYLVARDPRNSVVTYTADTLPDSLRSALGMLKLVEEGTLISGVGFRKEDGFLVLEDSNNA